MTTVDLRPSNPRVVHHARMMVDTTRSSRDLDAEDAEPGFDGMTFVSRAANPRGHFVGWTPGRTPWAESADLAWTLLPGTDLVVQLHLRPTGHPETVRAEVGLYFTDRPPAKASTLIMLGSEMLDIPAADPEYVVEDSYVLPVPVELLSVYPHAHYLGKTMDATARLPDGRTETFLHIPDWDFNWQDQYRFVEPLALPAGTELRMRFTYDNSADNPQNPHDPPERVRYGSLSSDEMADLILQAVPASREDAERLEHDLARKYERAAAAYAAWTEYTAGIEARAGGDLDAALRHFQASLRARDDVRVVSALADVVLAKGDPATASMIAERAVRMSASRDVGPLEVLSRARAAEGRREEAVDALERAVRLAVEADSTRLAGELRSKLKELKRGG